MASNDPIKRELELLDERLSGRGWGLEFLLEKAPMVVCAVGMVVGVGLGAKCGVGIWWWFAGMCLVAAIGGLAAVKANTQNRVKVMAAVVFGGFICLGGIRLFVFENGAGSDIRRFVGGERALATIKGEVLSNPVAGSKDSWAFGKYTWNKPGSSFYLRLSEVLGEDGWGEVSGVVRVQVGGGLKDVEPGDEIQAYCWLGGFSGAANPGQFDFAKYLAGKGVYVGATVDSRDGITVVEKAAAFSFAKIRGTLRGLATTALLGDIANERDQGDGMLAALVLGERGGLSRDVSEAFRKTGLSHFISLSGMHMGMLAAMLWWCCKIAGFERRWRGVVCILLLAIYVMIIPPRAATIRAVIICWVYFASVVLGRRTNSLNSLAIAMVIILGINPANLFGAGFQLSFSTVLGIILLQKRIAHSLFGFTVDKVARWEKVPAVLVLQAVGPMVVEMLAVGLAAWVGGAGILLYHFGTITPLSALWTVVVYPFILAIVAGGFLKLLLAATLPTAAILVGNGIDSVSNALIAFVKGIAWIDLSQMRVGEVSVVVVLCYYVFMFAGRFGKFRRASVCRVFYFAAVVVIFWPLVGKSLPFLNQGGLEMVCLDVGHGQAIYVNVGGRDLLFDAGSLNRGDCGGRIVVPFLRSRGVDRLDGIYVSHDDLDHFNGVPEIVELCRVDGVYSNEAVLLKAKGSSTAGFLRKNIEGSGVAFSLLADDGHVAGLWPTSEACADVSMSDNDKSQVLLIEYGGRKILLCSDIETYGQERVLEMYPDLQVDVLVMPHHGSTSNLVEGFAEKLGAKTIVISCSRSRIGNAYKARGDAECFYTAADGAISIWISVDGEINVSGFVSEKRQQY